MENFDYIFNKKDKELNYTSEIAIPMVCFCDIPLSQIRNHIKSYGGYAIGLSKEWAENKSINPVMYELPNSYPIKIMKNNMKILFKLFLNYKEQVNSDEAEEYMDKQWYHNVKEVAFDTYRFISFIKPYKGHNWNKKEFKFNGEILKFYDEREWRYVPEIELSNDYGLYPMLEKGKNINSSEALLEYNKILAKHFKLSFEPKDIKYIIVNSEEEIITMMDKIINIKGNKYSYDDIRILKSRIISKHQILEDF